MTKSTAVRTRLSALIGGLVFSLSLVSTASAVIIQDFESGLSNGSGTGVFVGDGNIIGTFGPGGTPAPSPTNQLLISTFNPGISGGGNSVATVTGAAGLESRLGLPAGTIQVPSGGAPLSGGQGSGFSFTLSSALNAGDVVGFSYDFMTNDNVKPDFAFAALLNLTTGTTTYINFANALTSTLVASPSPNFNAETGYQTFAGLTVPTAGNYALVIGVIDAANKNLPSGLLIDNLTVTPIPEPSTLALAAVGAIGAAGLIRRRRLAV